MASLISALNTLVNHCLTNVPTFSRNDLSSESGFKSLGEFTRWKLKASEKGPLHCVFVNHSVSVLVHFHSAALSPRHLVLILILHHILRTTHAVLSWFVVVCDWSTLPISFRITSPILGYPYGSPGAGGSTLVGVGKCLTWIHRNVWYNYNKRTQQTREHATSDKL